MTLLEIECFHCGEIAVPYYSRSGPHIKQSCSKCGKYKKFVSLNEIPHYQIYKQEIWQLTQDLKFIEQCKSLCKFSNEGNFFDNAINYCKLYLTVKNECSK